MRRDLAALVLGLLLYGGAWLAFWCAAGVVQLYRLTRSPAR